MPQQSRKEKLVKAAIVGTLKGRRKRLYLGHLTNHIRTASGYPDFQPKDIHYPNLRSLVASMSHQVELHTVVVGQAPQLYLSAR